MNMQGLRFARPARAGFCTMNLEPVEYKYLQSPLTLFSHGLRVVQPQNPGFVRSRLDRNLDTYLTLIG